MTRGACDDDLVDARPSGWSTAGRGTGSEMVSTTGSNMTLLALPWLVLETTGSPALMSFVVAADVAPVVLLSVPGGAVAGRLGVRRTLLAR